LLLDVDDRHRPTLNIEEVIQFKKELIIKTGLETLTGESDIVSLGFDLGNKCLQTSIFFWICLMAEQVISMK
jgi:hypothetical protein